MTLAIKQGNMIRCTAFCLEFLHLHIVIMGVIFKAIIVFDAVSLFDLRVGVLLFLIQQEMLRSYLQNRHKAFNVFPAALCGSGE